MNNTLEEHLVLASELRQRGIPYGRARIMQLVKAGKFPTPVRLSSRRLVWKNSELQSWIMNVASSKAA